jgi:protein-tyrosine phosphatase
VTTRFRILTVCTGNVCRSPMAERVLRHELAQRFDGEAATVEVSSAGTGALVGSAMTDPTQALVRALGADAEGHEARSLAESLVAEADLVLAMTRAHRGAVVSLVPRATRRTFTLREAARLASLVAPDELPDAPLADRLRAYVPALAARRGFVPVEHPGDDDITDPYRQSDAVYAAMGEELVPAVRAVLAPLGRR